MSGDFLFDMETFFLALADKTRLRLLNLLRQDEICVCFFTEVLNESQPKISRHLAYLRNAGIVEARRDGKWMHYKIVEPENEYAAQVLRDTLRWLESREEMQKDYEKLGIVCCAPTAPITIARAPKPNVFVEANIYKKDERIYEEKEEMETFLL
jgi:ArsR family transcriptional regulator, arsenate/arsenite/antimonite-responsive transcriptional repressor